MALALAACGGGDDKDEPIDSGGVGADASTGADGGASQDASTSQDSGTSMDSGGGNDAQVSSDTGAGDASMDSGKALAYAQGGKISALDAAASDAQGAALLVRVDGGTLVSLQVSGLVASTTYPAHVHNLPCAMQAGGHYQHVTDGGVNATNEVWPTLMTDDAGQGRSFVTVDKVLREDAVAIVVHDKDAPNPKLLCADLIAKNPFTTTGTPKPLAAADAGGVGGITGTASLTRGQDGTTEVKLEVQNLKASTEYMVHVHDQPCAFASGGGHYKFDYGNTGTVASNEIWLNFTSDAAGAGTKTVKVDHSARAEAQAIVIHAMDNTRLACIDLKP